MVEYVRPPLLRDEFVSIIARDLAVATHGMSVKTYLEVVHVLMSPEG